MAIEDYNISTSDTYFAEERDPKKFASAIFSFMEEWATWCETSGLADRWTLNQWLYQGVDPKQTDEDGYYTQESFRITGDNGELLRAAYNDYRNILQHVLNMNCSQPPNIVAKSINDDAKSLVAAQTFDGLMDFYLNTYRSGRLLRQWKMAVEGSLFQDIGSVLVEWDPNAGKLIGDDETGQLVAEGDLYFKFRSVWDCFYDPGVEDEDECEWVCVRDQMSKWELARRYPKFRDKIIRKGGATVSERLYNWRRGFKRPTKTDMIDVYKFYHRPSVALPQGRYALLLDAETVLNIPETPMDASMTDASNGDMMAQSAMFSDEQDSFVPNPYDSVPLFSIRAMEQQGGVLGYAPGNVLAPVQMSRDVLSSAMMTNYAMFGVQNIAVKDGDAFDVVNIAGGMNVVKYLESPPEPLQLAAQANGIFEMYQELGNTEELLGGINSVVRGDPETSLKSGKALGIIQAQAVQFQSGLAASSAQFLKNIGNFMLQVFRKNVKSKRVTEIVGKNNRLQSSTWDADTFGPINLVTAELMDPAMRTLGFKVDIADKLIDRGLVTSAKEYITVVTTGKLEPLIRGDETELNLIHQENEDMVEQSKLLEPKIEEIRRLLPPEESGPAILQLAAQFAPPVLEDDDDTLHMLEHRQVTAAPATRRNGAVVAIAMAHKQAHQMNAARKQQQLASQQALLQAQIAPNQQQQPVNNKQTSKPQ